MTELMDKAIALVEGGGGAKVRLKWPRSYVGQGNDLAFSQFVSSFNEEFERRKRLRLKAINDAERSAQIPLTQELPADDQEFLRRQVRNAIAEQKRNAGRAPKENELALRDARIEAEEKRLGRKLDDTDPFDLEIITRIEGKVEDKIAAEMAAKPAPPREEKIAAAAGEAVVAASDPAKRRRGRRDRVGRALGEVEQRIEDAYSELIRQGVTRGFKGDPGDVYEDRKPTGDFADFKDMLGAQVRTEVQERRQLHDASKRSGALGVKDNVTDSRSFVDSRSLPELRSDDPEVKGLLAQAARAEAVSSQAQNELAELDRQLQGLIPGYASGTVPTPRVPGSISNENAKAGYAAEQRDLRSLQDKRAQEAVDAFNADPGPLAGSPVEELDAHRKKVADQARADAVPEFARNRDRRRDNAQKAAVKAAQDRAVRVRVESRVKNLQKQGAFEAFTDEKDADALVKEVEAEERALGHQLTQKDLNSIRRSARDTFDYNHPTQPPVAMVVPLSVRDIAANDELERAIATAQPLLERRRQLVAIAAGAQVKAQDSIKDARERAQRPPEILALEDRLNDIRGERQRLYNELSSLDHWDPSDFRKLSGTTLEQARRYVALGKSGDAIQASIGKLKSLQQDARSKRRDSEEAKVDPGRLASDLSSFLVNTGLADAPYRRGDPVNRPITRRQAAEAVGDDLSGFQRQGAVGNDIIARVRTGVPTETVPYFDPDDYDGPYRTEIRQEEEMVPAPGESKYQQVQTVAKLELQALEDQIGAVSQDMVAAQARNDSAAIEDLEVRLRGLRTFAAQQAEIAGRLDEPHIAGLHDEWLLAKEIRRDVRANDLRIRRTDPSKPPYTREEEKQVAEAWGIKDYPSVDEAVELESIAGRDFRDAFFEETPIGGVAYGMQRGEYDVIGMPAGGQTKRHSPRDGADLQQGPYRGKIQSSRMRGNKAGDRAQPFSRVEMDVDKDIAIASAEIPSGRTLEREVKIPVQSKEENLVERLGRMDPNSSEAAAMRDRIKKLKAGVVTKPIDLTDRKKGLAQLELVGPRGDVIATAPVEMTRTARGFVPTRQEGFKVEKAIKDAAAIAGGVASGDERRRWPKGTPWQPKGPGPGRFRGDFDAHIFPMGNGSFEVHATPFGTKGRKNIVAKNPSDVDNPRARVDTRPGETESMALGAAIAKAQAMTRQGRDKTKIARVFQHSQYAGSAEPRHIADVGPSDPKKPVRSKKGSKRKGLVAPPGDLTDSFRMQEAFSANLFAAMKKRVRQAHSRFQLESLQSLYPDLAGPLFEQRYEEERLRDEEFLTRLEGRLRLKIESAIADPTLTARDKAQKARAALNAERGYFKRHLNETAWRMARTAEIVRLKEAGEPGAYWLMDKGLKSHTKDCLAMEGRVWEWDVLDMINPANRHPGCGCKLISEAEAFSRALSVTKGLITLEWREAVGPHLVENNFGEQGDALSSALAEFDADQPRHPKGDPKGGQWRKTLERLGLKKQMDEMFAFGGVEEQRKSYNDLLHQIRYEVPTENRAEALRAMQNMLATLENPMQTRVKQGSPQRAAYLPGNDPSLRPTARRVIDVPGRDTGWTKSGGFGYEIPASLVNSLKKPLQGVAARNDAITLTELEGGGLYFEHPDLADARELEIAVPTMRTLRAMEAGTPNSDDTPLDIGDNERTKQIRREKERTHYRNVDLTQLGRTGEALIDDVTARLKEMSLIDQETQAKYVGMDSALDWEIGPFVVEVKTQSFRGEIPNVMNKGPGISPADAAKKEMEIKLLNMQREREALLAGLKPGDAGYPEPLKPLIVQVLVDLDNDLGHVFAQDRSGRAPGSIFTAARLPLEAIRGVFSGQMLPDEDAYPERGPDARLPQKFIGTFRLRYNPLKKGEPGRVPTQQDMEAFRQEERDPFDFGLPAPPAEGSFAAHVPYYERTTKPERIRPKNPRPPSNWAVNEERKQRKKAERFAVKNEVVELAIKHLDEFGNAQQKLIAQQVRMDQSAVSRILSKSPEYKEAVLERKDAKAMAPAPKPKVKQKAEDQVSERDRAIADAYRSGEAPKVIAKRYKVSIMAIHRTLDSLPDSIRPEKRKAGRPKGRVKSYLNEAQVAQLYALASASWDPDDFYEAADRMAETGMLAKFLESESS